MEKRFTEAELAETKQRAQEILDEIGIDLTWWIARLPL